MWFTKKWSAEVIDIKTFYLTFFTFGARAIPGFSKCGTAMRLQCSSIYVDLTAIIDYLQPTGALCGLCYIKQ